MIFDIGNLKKTLRNIPSMEPETRERVRASLLEEGVEATIEGALEVARRR
jgi:hypothetical protein